ncbi:MAG: hypothetical protein M1828_001152 [Chrysothrix sp. TS-e1954]|nr:MAG: hypothetical protein M1828_001152 [Chrysothrix sp. TS-e1954]
MPSKRKADEALLDPEEPDTTIDPYTVLSIPRTATSDAIKKAYRKAALQNHPDKASPETKEHATETFQRIAFAYAILSSPRRRARYDATGSTSEVLLDADDDFDWLSFYREQFRDVVTEEAIEGFSERYKGSEEERRDILDAYVKFKGDMDGVYESVMLSDVLVDDARIRQVIEDALEAETVQPYSKYTKETQKSKDNRIKAAKRAAAKAEKRAEEMKQEAKTKGHSKKSGAGAGQDDLLAMIQGRQKERGNAFLDNLTAKYTNQYGAKKGKKKRVAVDEPPEEAFEANRKKASKLVA